MKVAVLNFYYLNYQKSVEKTEIFKSVQSRRRVKDLAVLHSTHFFLPLKKKKILFG
jgi:hypothetical protein